MKDDMTKKSADAPAAAATRVDRRTFLLNLSGGALALAASGLLAGCGGGANGGGGGFSSSTGGQVQNLNYQNVPFTSGGISGLASLVVHVQPGGAATGTLTIQQFLLEAARPHVPSLPGLPVELPAGTYTFTGTASNLTAAGFTLTGNANYAPFAGDTFDTATSGPFTLTVVLPTATQAGSFEGTFNGDAFSGTLPATGSSSSSSSSSSSTTTGTGFMASISGNIQSPTPNTGPNQFQIGPSTATAGTATLVGLPGTLTVTSANLAGLPSSSLSFSLFANVPTQGTDASTYNYAGTYAIYTGTDPTISGSVVSSGTFTATAVFTGTEGLIANVTGSFTATAGDTVFSPSSFTGTFNSTGASQNQTLNGTLTYNAF